MCPSHHISGRTERELNQRMICVIITLHTIELDFVVFIAKVRDSCMMGKAFVFISNMKSGNKMCLAIWVRLLTPPSAPLMEGGKAEKQRDREHHKEPTGEDSCLFILYYQGQKTTLSSS